MKCCFSGKSRDCLDPWFVLTTVFERVGFSFTVLVEMSFIEIDCRRLMVLKH